MGRVSAQGASSHTRAAPHLTSRSSLYSYKLWEPSTTPTETSKPQHLLTVIMAEDPLAPKSAAVARPPSALSHQSSEVTSPSRGGSSKGGSPPLGGSPVGMRAGSLTLSGGASEDADEHDQAGKTMFWFFHGSFSAPIIKLLLHVTVVALVHEAASNMRGAHAPRLCRRCPCTTGA